MFESKLKELFSQCVKCPNCGRNVKNLTLKTEGSLTHNKKSWMLRKAIAVQRQLFVSSMAAGNLLLSAGILFTRNSYGSVAKATNTKFFSERSYNETQTSYLFSIVD